jgi:DNA-binding NarL/FixJ family response regulator
LASIDARGNLLSSRLASESQSRRHASKGASIVLIDRRPLTRQCISRWIQVGTPDRHLVSVASPADLLGGLGSAINPDIIIFSIGAAPVSDSEVSGKITLLRHRMSRIPLVLLSDRDDLDDIIEAMEQGVRGYIPTSLEPFEAAAALQCVASGGTFVPASAMIKLAAEHQSRSKQAGKPEANPLRDLTPRESQVVACLRQGKPNKLIAHELGISESTVKVFVRLILRKLHVSNRTEVAVLARDRAGSRNGYQA